MFPSGNHAPSEPFEGGYYSIIDGDEFAIAKVLKIDPEIVHLRIYKQHFSARPQSINTAQLTLGTIFDEDGFGMSHLPLRAKTFLDREPVFIKHSEVTPDELKGYETWKEVQGGAFA